ncbi:MAG: recombinase family protein [Bacteroidia bacterium]
MQKFIPYYRVSTKKQGNSHLGLEAQTSSVENYVRTCSGEIITSFTEIETAGNKDKISIGQQVSIESLLRKRPLLLEAINTAQTHNAILVVKESSRLTRFSLLLEFLLKSNLQFVCADSPNDTPFITKLKTSLAEEELLRISERTKAALAALKARGFVRDNSNHGLTKDNIQKGIEKRIELALQNENNRRATGYIMSLQKAGYTFQKMADELNNNGFKSSRNKEFYASSVHMLWNRAISKTNL